MSFIQRSTIECNGTLSGERSFPSTDVRADTMRRSLAPLRNSSASALLNYAFSWLEYGKRACHFWMFTLNKTDAMSHMLQNPRTADALASSVASFSESTSMKVALLWRIKEDINRKMMLHERKINNADSSREWHVMRINIYVYGCHRLCFESFRDSLIPRRDGDKQKINSSSALIDDALTVRLLFFI